MPKKVRKPSKDPKIEELLRKKDEWDNKFSDLMKDMGAFKRGFRGIAQPSHGIPSSKIRGPVPSEVLGLLSEISSRYAGLAGEAKSLSEAQSAVSKDMDSKKKVQAQDDSLLVAEGSSLASRILYRAKKPFSKRKEKGYLYEMHTALLDLKDVIEELQDSIFSSKHSTEDLKSSFKSYANVIDVIISNFQLAVSASDREQAFKYDPSVFIRVSDVESRYRFYEREFEIATAIGVIGFMRKFKEIAAPYIRDPNNDFLRRDIMTKIEHLYHNMKAYTSSRYDKLPTWSTFSELQDLVGNLNINHAISDGKGGFENLESPQPRNAEDYINIYAQEFLWANSLGLKQYKKDFDDIKKIFSQANESEQNHIIEKVKILHSRMLDDVKSNYLTQDGKSLPEDWKSLSGLHNLVSGELSRKPISNLTEENAQTSTADPNSAVISYYNSEFTLAAIMSSGLSDYKKQFYELDKAIKSISDLNYQSKYIEKIKELYARMIEDVKRNFIDSEGNQITESWSTLSELHDLKPGNIYRKQESVTLKLNDPNRLSFYNSEFHIADAMGASEYNRHYIRLQKIFFSSTGDKEIEGAFEHIKSLYQDMIKDVKNNYLKVPKDGWESLSDLYRQIKTLQRKDAVKQAQTSHYTLLSVATNVRLKNLKRNFMLGDYKQLRKSLYDRLTKALVTVNEFLDTIEDEKPLEDVRDKVKSIKSDYDETFTRLYPLLKILETKQTMEDHKAARKEKSSKPSMSERKEKFKSLMPGPFGSTRR